MTCTEDRDDAIFDMDTTLRDLGDDRRYPMIGTRIYNVGPWRELKDAEIALLSHRRSGTSPPDGDWQRLRELFDLCSVDPDASDSVCYHGVAALLAEHDGDYNTSLTHRRIEIDKIVWLQEEEERNPTNGFQNDKGICCKPHFLLRNKQF